MMKKKLIVLLCCSMTQGMYRIQNSGQAGSGFIAVYDQSTKKSTLINGYADVDNDNGHCAQGTISDKAITILIPENPAKFGYINTSCIAGEDGTVNYNPFCSTYCGGPVTDGEVIQVQGVPDYANCSVNPGPNLMPLPNVAEYGTIYCRQQTQATVHVSPVCQQLGAYFKENFAQGGNIKSLVEYAQCDPSELSYCSISFVPSKAFSVSINTDYLSGINHAVPGLCSKQSVCSMTMQGGATNSCQLNITSPFYGSGVTALNSWLSQNSQNIFNPQPFEYVSPVPDGYFGKCTKLPEAVIENIRDTLYDTAEDDKDTVLHNRLNMWKNRFKFFQKRYEETKLPFYLNQMKKYEIDYYQQEIKLNTLLSQNFGQFISQQANNDFLCTGGYSTDSAGNIQVTYTCSTQGYTPNYTCNYVYQANDAAANPNATFALQTAYCNFPLDDIVFSSPTLGGSDFNCGFCGQAELASVGNSTQDFGIEAVYGKAGQLFPFATGGLGFNPTCPSGFISRLDNLTPSSSNLTLYNTLNNSVPFLYNQVWGNVGYPQTTFGGGLKTFSAPANSAKGMFGGNFWANGVMAGTCNQNKPQASASCLGIAPGSINDFGGAYAFGVSSSVTDKMLAYVGTGNTAMQCTSKNPSCAVVGAQPQQAATVPNANTYIISNQGQHGSGYIGLYDTEANNSILIDGYAQAASDNGHCAQGTLNNQELTLIIPENLWGFGYVNAQCTAATQGNTKYDPLCITYCGGTITEGSVVEEAATLNYAACTPNPQINAQKMMINGQAMYCPVQTTVNHLHVSPLCQNIGAYIKNNFANPAATSFKITEYASCKQGDTSYCSVTFVPKATSFKLAINTDTFNGPALPATCSTTTCSLATSAGTKKCLFAINDTTYGAGLTALGAWYTKNSSTLTSGSVAMPTASYTCSGNASSSCSGTYSFNEKGDLVVVYSCSTSTTPSYICNFVYYLPKGATQWMLSGSSCSFEINKSMMQSPTLGDPDFNCGFCSATEWHSVGNNTASIPLESSYGTVGELFPFATQGATNPTCMNGFIAQLNPEKIYNNQEASSIVQESNGIMAYNFSGNPYVLNVGFAASYVSPTVTVQDGCQLLYIKGDVINGINFNNHPTLHAPVGLSSWPFLNGQGWAYAAASLSKTGQSIYALNVPFDKTFNCVLSSGCTDVTSALGINWHGLPLMTQAPACTQNKAIV